MVEAPTSTQFKLTVEKESCSFFDKTTGYCSFYLNDCLHNEGPIYRCYGAKPRIKEELQPWMKERCSDCPEINCNICDVYRNYHMPRF